ncbi:nitrite reductase/ring-hydroxylating ferredoxin subunit [Neobacillus niacini]|uniref:Rieske (2Fe-2S) protein n=1 Tax=Neobacillus niacini TaxID=86668 RepID=UPI00285C0D2B|nr:Rieske (2Fe-2S) protein [Neobacillus niacini]MDR7075755.1 nitrite reductase/ring-hydroxylating ferredoxin subunit [Neobacillus niacini]
MGRNILCNKEDIKPGEKKVFQVGRASVLVVRNGEKFYAIRNACPHQGAELDKGFLGPVARSSQVKEFCLEEHGGHIYCPWHRWSFDLETGCSDHDPANEKVKTYDVKVEGNDLVVYA